MARTPGSKNIVMSDIGINEGDELTFIPTGAIVTFIGGRNIEYDGEKMTMVNAVRKYAPNLVGGQTNRLFSYKGVKLCNIKSVQESNMPSITFVKKYLKCSDDNAKMFLTKLNEILKREESENREKYLSENMFLKYANKPPREVGEYMEDYILSHNSGLFKSDDDSYDLKTSSGIRLEVKVSRVLRKKSNEDETMEDRMKSVEESDDNEKMNFQQVKPLCTDYFVLVAMYRNGLRSWLIKSTDMIDLFTRQHRGGDDTEGQVWVAPNKIKEYECDINNICDKIK